MKSFSPIKIIFFSLVLLLGAANLAYASETDGTIITGGNAGFAWSDQTGWVNFGVTNGNIHITDSGSPAGEASMSGYAWNANYGWINMAPTSASTNVGVKVSAAGALSGYAWGSSLGWINFSGVSINSSGKFIGQATGSIVGTLTFDCANCDVRTDFRPANFRAATTPPSVSSGGGGGGGGGFFPPTVTGSGGQAVPARIEAYDVPMRLFPAQSGTLTQNLTDGKTIRVEVPSNVIATDELTIIASERPASVDVSVSTVVVLGEVLFNVVARDSAGNLIHTFLKPIQITLTIPNSLQGRSDLGVYYFDEGQGLWVKISDAVFSGNSAIFSVNHLTLFGIFSASDLPSFLQPFFSIPAPAIGPFPGTTPSLPAGQVGQASAGMAAGTEAVPEETGASPEETIPEALFDIRLFLDRASVARIVDLVARVTFESFGRVPASVEMTFSIIGGDGQELWKSVDTTTVQTEAVFVKRFLDANELAPGSYTLLLRTLYDSDSSAGRAGVKDVFEAQFSIAPEGASSYWIFWLALGLVAVAAIAFFAWLRKRQRETQI
ncbi:MAG: hypothetical protein HYV52_00555 [Parcubacteria group bacterium]|nr:hypothetical protein [Parcubacteria group bacterium]